MFLMHQLLDLVEEGREEEEEGQHLLSVCPRVREQWSTREKCGDREGETQREREREELGEAERGVEREGGSERGSERASEGGREGEGEGGNTTYLNSSVIPSRC